MQSSSLSQTDYELVYSLQAFATLLSLPVWTYELLPRLSEPFRLQSPQYRCRTTPFAAQLEIQSQSLLGTCDQQCTLCLTIILTVWCPTY